MNLSSRSFWLKAMLWTLAATAAIGVFSVFMNPGLRQWWFAGLAVSAPICFGVMMFFVPLIDRERSRLAGIIGVGTCIAEFALALSLVLFARWGGWSYEEVLVFTMLALALWAGIAACFARVLSNANTRLGSLVGMATCALAFVICVLAKTLTLTNVSLNASNRLVLAGVWIGLLGCAAGMCLFRSKLGRARLLRLMPWIGLVASVIGIGLTVVGYLLQSDWFNQSVHILAAIGGAHRSCERVAHGPAQPRTWMGARFDEIRDLLLRSSFRSNRRALGHGR